MNVVIVESAAKAKTINKYLGSGFKVIPSYGHVRDLPSKDGSVEPAMGVMTVNVTVQGGGEAALVRSDAQIAQALARAVSRGARRL